MVSSVSESGYEASAVLRADGTDEPAAPPKKFKASEPLRITMGVGTALGLRAVSYAADSRHHSARPEMSPLATVAVALARLPNDIRGFGPVKEKSVAAAQEQKKELLAQFAKPAGTGKSNRRKQTEPAE